ncbi:response regulator [Dictyobacter arantiisoli]|nr:response regulator [Dictyobacter arantiisoli]
MQSRQILPKSILVVDDDPDIVDFLRELLEMEGYSVATTARIDYIEGLPKRNLPDLILLDVFLSGNDGRDLVKYIKSQEGTRPIPVIMFSAHPGVETSVRAAGADDFLAKPFDLDELLKKIEAYLF